MPSATSDSIGSRRHRPSPFDATKLSLQAGEAAAIAFAITAPGSLLLTDDEAARHACAELRVAATGTLGLIIEAAHARRVSRVEAARALASLPTSGRMHVSAALLARAVAALPAE